MLGNYSRGYACGCQPSVLAARGKLEFAKHTHITLIPKKKMQPRPWTIDLSVICTTLQKSLGRSWLLGLPPSYPRLWARVRVHSLKKDLSTIILFFLEVSSRILILRRSPFFSEVGFCKGFWLDPLGISDGGLESLWIWSGLEKYYFSVAILCLLKNPD
jgi:hypothetical protein